MPSENHFAKYEALTNQIGLTAIKAKILASFSIDYIKQKSGEDEHLNNIPLAIWDNMAGNIAVHPRVKLSMSPPWNHFAANHLSLAERVCTLKHVAREHIAKE